MCTDIVHPSITIIFAFASMNYISIAFKLLNLSGFAALIVTIFIHGREQLQWIESHEFFFFVRLLFPIFSLSPTRCCIATFYGAIS